MQQPGPAAAYFAASNQHDIKAMLALFSTEAVVKDEGQERRGLAAVRQWMEETTSKYLPVVEVIGAVEAASSVTVTGKVSGNFPGSPVELHYAFTLDGGKIARLEISA